MIKKRKAVEAGFTSVTGKFELLYTSHTAMIIWCSSNLIFFSKIQFRIGFLQGHDANSGSFIEDESEDIPSLRYAKWIWH
jgi:hypothetical protein